MSNRIVDLFKEQLRDCSFSCMETGYIRCKLNLRDRNAVLIDCGIRGWYIGR